MKRQVFVRAEAEADLAEAFLWYEEQRPGLGNDLLLSVEAALEAIARRPESFPIVHHGIRRTLLRRFPYGVFFLLENKQVIVLAVLHAARDPKHWQDRPR